MFWKFGLTLYVLSFFSLIWRRHHYRWRTNLTYTQHYSPLSIALPHLLWHGASVYNGHLRGSVALTPDAERLAEELSLPGLSRLGFEHLTYRMRGERANRLRHHRGLVIMRLPPNYKNVDWLNYYMVFKVVSV